MKGGIFSLQILLRFLAANDSTFLQNFASETHLFNSCNFYEVKSSVAKSPKLFPYVFPQDFVLNLRELGDDSLRHMGIFFTRP